MYLEHVLKKVAEVQEKIGCYKKRPKVPGNLKIASPENSWKVSYSGVCTALVNNCSPMHKCPGITKNACNSLGCTGLKFQSNIHCLIIARIYWSITIYEPSVKTWLFLSTCTALFV